MSQNPKTEQNISRTQLLKSMTFIVMEINCTQHWRNHSFGSSRNKGKVVRMNFQIFDELLEHTRALRVKRTFSFSKDIVLVKVCDRGCW